jgi:hypothetical protein
MFYPQRPQPARSSNKIHSTQLKEFTIMKIKNHLRAGERKSIARYQAHFSGARLMAGTVYRVASLFAPIAVFAVLSLSAAHFAGTSHHSHFGSLDLTHFGVMGLTLSPVLKNLNKQKDELLTRQEAILNSASEAKRKLSDAENTEFDNHTATINDLNTQIDRHTAIAAERGKLALPTSQAIVPANKGKGLGKVIKLTEEYAEAFFANFLSLAEFATTCFSKVKMRIHRMVELWRLSFMRVRSLLLRRPTLLCASWPRFARPLTMSKSLFS